MELWREVSKSASGEKSKFSIRMGVDTAFIKLGNRFIPPLRALDLRGDMELVSCLESPGHHLSTLATIMLGCEEFNFVGSIEKFSEILKHRCQTTLRLEIGRLIYTRYRDPQVLRKETVPNLIASRY